MHAYLYLYTPHSAIYTVHGYSPCQFIFAVVADQFCFIFLFFYFVYVPFVFLSTVLLWSFEAQSRCESECIFNCVYELSVTRSTIYTFTCNWEKQEQQQQWPRSAGGNVTKPMFIHINLSLIVLLYYFGAISELRENKLIFLLPATQELFHLNCIYINSFGTAWA